MIKRQQYIHQFTPWCPGKFIAYDVIDDAFEKMGRKAMVIARNAEFAADCFLANAVINQNKKVKHAKQ